MKTILFLLQKEFIQIFRNKAMIPIIFFVPIFQLIILVHAATFEMKNIRLYVVDNDLSSTSRQMVSKFEGSPFFKIEGRSFSSKTAEEELKHGQADIILQIPEGFEKNLVKEGKDEVQLIINAINGTTAGLTYAYATNVIADYNRQIMVKSAGMTPEGISKTIAITQSFWYNPELNYKTFMVPGILVLLVTIISLMLSSMNVVREKEIGTIEQINVTPIRKYQFIMGKLLPTWVIAMFELAFGLTLGKLLFNIPMVGNLWLIFMVASVYIVVILAMGLLVSTITNTQQQAMFISFFFMMIFILMGGLFTAIENMPVWAQYLDKLNPVAYFIKIIRMVLLKGSSFADFKKEFFFLVIYAIVMFSLAVRRYRKTV
ncbi:MAG TPA: ABC transporter permease [Bacteroidales bacterium]|nr:ABC transporter permease [Bacteroidales bacterium]